MCFRLFRKKKSEPAKEDIFVPATSSLVNFIQLNDT